MLLKPRFAAILRYAFGLALPEDAADAAAGAGIGAGAGAGAASPGAEPPSFRPERSGVLPSEPGGVPGALTFAFLAFDTAALIFASKLDIAVRKPRSRARHVPGGFVVARARSLPAAHTNRIRPLMGTY